MQSSSFIPRLDVEMDFHFFWCLGMNDYASTLLYVMREESLAYVCFCSIMRRIRASFTTDGVAISTKLLHLKVLLQAIDPVYWSFFESCDAGKSRSWPCFAHRRSSLWSLVNLYFTYRWLLLECKREFPFNDALRVLEVMWATLPIDNEPPVLSELVLITSPSENMIADILSQTSDPPSVRRANSCPSLSVPSESNARKSKHRSFSVSCKSNEQLKSALQKQRKSQEQDEFQPHSICSKTKRATFSRSREATLGNSFSLSEIADFNSDSLNASASNSTTSSHNIAQFLSSTDWLQRLPTGDTMWLDEENSFLLFSCISILLAHRSYLLKQKNIDEQEISMHFDRYRRRHNAERILHCARTLYGQYIQWARKKRVIDDLNRFSES